jgi:hypothetical protein
MESDKGGVPLDYAAACELLDKARQALASGDRALNSGTALYREGVEHIASVKESYPTWACGKSANVLAGRNQQSVHF